MALVLEVNAGVLVTMVGALWAHEATAFRDVHFAEARWLPLGYLLG